MLMISDCDAPFSLFDLAVPAQSLSNNSTKHAKNKRKQTEKQQTNKKNPPNTSQTSSPPFPAPTTPQVQVPRRGTNFTTTPRHAISLHISKTQALWNHHTRRVCHVVSCQSSNIKPSNLLLFHRLQSDIHRTRSPSMSRLFCRSFSRCEVIGI